MNPPAERLAPVNGPVKFHIDQPASGESWPQIIIIRGWAFTSEGGPIEGIRLSVGDLVLVGAVGLARPDVKAALSDAPNDYTGFELRGQLPPGKHDSLLSARLVDGRWVELLAQRISVSRRWLPLWIKGDWAELLHSQMPTQPAHPPRAMRPERFPVTNGPRPRLAIVTPSYQQAQFLDETIRSVLDQPGVICDYVVQDGGSADGSVEVIKRHSSRLHGWASELDRGQADAIARGLARTAGGPEDLMAWINSDDFYLPGALGFVTEYFARHPEVDAIYGHRILVDENSREIGRWFVPPHDQEILRLNDFVPQETLFWRRRIWDCVGGLDATFQFAMDWDLLLRFQAKGARIVRVPYFLGCFRVHAAQKTSAQIRDTGEAEMARLRMRSFGRLLTPSELEQNPRLLKYLRRSAWIRFLWQVGCRAP